MKLMRILIVEDDAALASFIRKGLEAEHHAVDVSNEGNQGRSMAMEVDYDLVVLDLNLPGVDGLSVLKSLRQRKANLPVMILTARSRIEDRVQCLDSGADDYLVNPGHTRPRAASRRHRVLIGTNETALTPVSPQERPGADAASAFTVVSGVHCPAAAALGVGAVVMVPSCSSARVRPDGLTAMAPGVSARSASSRPGVQFFPVSVLVASGE